MSALEDDFLVTLQRLAPDLPAPVREFPFAAPARRFRADFAFPAQRLLIELQGGVWNRGKHGRGSGIEKDADKLNHAAVRGYRTLMFTRKRLDEDPAGVVDTVREALGLLWT